MEYVIETQNLNKLFKSKRAVDDISIHVARGEIYGLIGKNGAGKTTLLKMLLGLIEPSSGFMNILHEPNLNKARHRIGSLIEAPGLYRGKTARENLIEFSILFGAPLDQVDELLKLVGLDNVGKKKVKAFSLGMKQRLGLAIALIGEPEILLLDEPVNGLDPEGIMSFRNIVEDIHQKRNVTMIISSHLLDELGKIATKYGIINNGKLVEEKTMDEIKELCGNHLRIETNDNPKAFTLLSNKFADMKIENTGDALIIKSETDSRAKVNAFLIKEGIDILSSSIVTNDLEKFFVERLK